jgi:hypothetical protein
MQTLNPTPERAGLSPAYPAPPRVHWLVLFLVPIMVVVVLLILASNTEPAVLSIAVNLSSTLFYGAWTIYLCLWIRDLNPRSKTLILAFAVSGIYLAADVIHLFLPPPDPLYGVSLFLRLPAAILGLWLIFEIRDELYRHYNEREPIGLKLSPYMTFFFSYYYFQYHLYRIAKEKEAQSHPGLGSSLP